MIPPAPSLKGPQLEAHPCYDGRSSLWRPRKVLAELVADDRPGHSHLFTLTADSFKHGSFQMVEARPMIFLLLLDPNGHQVKVDGRHSSINIRQATLPHLQAQTFGGKADVLLHFVLTHLTFFHLLIPR